MISILDFFYEKIFGSQNNQSKSLDLEFELINDESQKENNNTENNNTENNNAPKTDNADKTDKTDKTETGPQNIFELNEMIKEHHRKKISNDKKKKKMKKKK